tara:strand:+ start:1344 stop:1466 length:123 start_codon:yes stop_codon:yes gene_type:complete
MILDTRKDNMYAMDAVNGDRHWKLLAPFQSKDENEKEYDD